MKKIIIITGHIRTIDPAVVKDIANRYQDAVICHRENLNEFDEELRPKLLEAINDAENNEAKIYNFVITKINSFPLPTLHFEKKGKHTPRQTSKYLWKR